MIEKILNNGASDQIAIITETGDQVTYSKLSIDVKNVGSTLKDRELIFIVCRNDYVSVLYYLAAMDVGAVPLLLGSDTGGEQLKQLTDIYAPQFILTPEAFESVSNDYERHSIYEHYCLYRSKQQVRVEIHQDLAFLATTSGSTGDPKLVRLSTENLTSNAKSIAEYLEIKADDRAITSLPINYSYGLSVVNSHLIAGGSIVLSDHSLMEREFWGSLNDHSVTSFAGVPYHYEMLLRLGLQRLNIPTIKKMTQAGGRLAAGKMEKVYAFCEEKGIKFWTMYGQTEASPRISYVPSEMTAKKPDSIGIAIPGGKLWIKSEDGQDISKSSETGELVYEGDNVCLGYALSAADLALGDENKRVLSTGDLARSDKDGYFYLEGRIKRFLKVYGNRISLEQVEKIVHELGFEGVAHGQDDQLVVHIVESQTIDLEDIKRKISDEAGVQLSAIRVDEIEEIPRLATGKVDYQCLNNKV